MSDGTVKEGVDRLGTEPVSKVGCQWLISYEYRSYRAIHNMITMEMIAEHPAAFILRKNREYAEEMAIRKTLEALLAMDPSRTNKIPLPYGGTSFAIMKVFSAIEVPPGTLLPEDKAIFAEIYPQASAEMAG